MAGHLDLKLVIFGDQTFDLTQRWKDLFHLRNNPAVEDFLAKSYIAVRNEIYSLPVDIRNNIPRFTCLNDLILSNQTGPRRVPAIDTAVACVYELATFISQADAWYHGDGQIMAMGLCLGGLASAAVCTSRTTIELIPRAVDAVKAAFRTGAQGSEMAARLVPRTAIDELEGEWSVLVSGATASDALSKYCERTALSTLTRPYISASSSNSITVSGSPSALAQLMASNEFKGLRFKSLPVYGPLHAPHLFAEANVDAIIEGLGKDCGAERSKHIAYLSSTGAFIKGPNFVSLLKSAVDAIVAKPMRFVELLDQLRDHIQAVNPKSLKMIPICTTVDRMIYNTFKSIPLAALMPPPPPAQQKPSVPEASPPNPKTAKLAIIGMAGRFPGGANDTEAFWDLLYEGLDVHKSVPPRRWDVETHIDLTLKKKNTGGVPWGCWLDDAGLFDARFFNISPREAPQMDPAQRLALLTAHEAIEKAGIVLDATPSTRPDRVGVFYGVTANDWAETNSAQDIDAYAIPGGNRAFVAGRINYFYKFSGPSYVVDTACSSALSAIHIACNSIWRGDIDTAIAGGTNVITNPDPHAGLDRGHFLSRTGNCKTFDDGADGYCRGEGVGTVIIKRLEDAIADNDNILAVVLDTMTNHSSESESITRPHEGAQKAIFSKLMNQGVIDPYSVGYIEMHGTGTQVGDHTEMSSVLSSFAPPLSEVPRGRKSDEALFLGSAKANIGHGEASSGSSALIKVLMMMQKNTILPHCGIKTKINRKFPTDLAERNVHIPLKPTPWERSSDPNKPRRALVNNFGAAGGNTAILLEDAPLKTEFLEDPRSVHVIAVSAKSGTAVQGNLKSLLKYLRENPDTPLGSLSYTTTARRAHYQHRVMLSGSRVQDVCNQIEAALENKAGVMRPKSTPKFVFTFTGQGAQYPGMGKELLTNFGVFQNAINRLDQICQGLGFPSVLPVLQADEDQDINTFMPVAVQLASICMQIALTKLWASWNIVPVAVVGHSLGEYAALNYASVLSDADTLYLVGKRAEILQKKCSRDTHAMLVVRGSVDEITADLGEATNTIEFACINSPVETVLAGTNEAIEKVKTTLTDKSRKSTSLKVPFAFHSAQMDPMLQDLEEVAQTVTFSKPKLPVLCPLDGRIVEDEGIFGPKYLVRHSRQPVNMISALLAARHAKYMADNTMTIEIGPHPAMGGMVRGVLGPQIPTLASNQRGRSIWSVLTTTLKQMYIAGAEISWQEYHADFMASLNMMLLPTYSWDLKDYWMTYVNNWSLRKGEPPEVIERIIERGGPKLETSTIHRTIEEIENADGSVHLVVESDITRSDMSPLVQGHEIDGIPLCTPSVWADIALSLGTYFLQRYRPGHNKNVVDVTEMTILKALILRHGSSKQLVQVHSDVDWSSSSAKIKFMSFDNKQKLQEHANCRVVFKDRSLQKTLQKDVPAVMRKIQKLRDGILSGKVARYNGAMCYRAIRPLAKFHPDYRVAGELLLNSETLEAASRSNFTNVKQGGTFHTHPGVIDGLSQICGFVMNCNDSADLDGDVFMNHGWKSLQLFEPIDLNAEYTTYTHMVQGKADPSLWFGDVVILNSEDQVAAYFGQAIIQQVARRVLKVILTLESGQKSQSALKQMPTQKTPASVATPAQVKSAPKPTTPAHAAISTTKVTQVAPIRTQTSNTEKAMAIIAEESGVALEDLTNDTDLAECGVDSLLGLTIQARLKEELELEVDFCALLFEFPTVGELRPYFGGGESTSLNILTSATMTPISSNGQGSAASSVNSSPPSTIGDVTSLEEKDVPRGTNDFDFSCALKVISEESGVALEDLTSDTVFADAGIDSLLSLVVVSRFKDELDLKIANESLFMDCPTVGQLKVFLCGKDATRDGNIGQPDAIADSKIQEQINSVSPPVSSSQHTPAEKAALVAREKAVDKLVAKYTAGYSGPAPASQSALSTKDNEKVVLITGASGSLGSHLTYHISQLPDVQRVICLNRNNREEPIKRQIKAMRDKGIRFPEALKYKLVVLQTDTSKHMLGLEPDVYEELVGTVTHLIHSAWPMSGKRALDGFESQFQVMKNLIKLSCDISSQRPPSVKFSFQLVSSIGVIGLYGKTDVNKKVKVPEERFGIDCVLNNGYGDAKWGCERMLDETLHQHPDRFRAMVVRLGQIAGSKTSGYWNPLEHFGFLVKSAQTLNALPDVPGEVYWTPVNDMADTLADLVLGDHDPYRFYHLENPIGQSWKQMNAILMDATGIQELIPFEEWRERVMTAPQKDNPVQTLVDFLDDNFIRMSYGRLVMDPKHTLEHSKSLRAVAPISENVVRKYVHIWKEIGFLRNQGASYTWVP